jgi:hypothetical protein
LFFVFFVSSWCYEVEIARHREESMVAIAREVAPGRWRASAGRYFEDFTIGDIYEHRPGRRSARPTTPGSPCRR